MAPELPTTPGLYLIHHTSHDVLGQLPHWAPWGQCRASSLFLLSPHPPVGAEDVVALVQITDEGM